MADDGVEPRIDSLRRFNLGMGVLHLFQGVAMLALATDFALPVTASFVELNPETQSLEPALRTLFDLKIGPLVAGFLFLSAIAHVIVSTVSWDWYRGSIARGINPARWVEYSMSASLMIVVIAMLAGILDVVSLLALFAINAAMILFGWLMELHAQHTERTDWLPFWFGSIAGIIPWVAITIYLVGAGGPDGGPPGFVYGIFASLFVFFNIFAINMVLQYRQIGKWRDYLYGERAYMYLSLFAKSALAWQVFAGTLRPV